MKQHFAGVYEPLDVYDLFLYLYAFKGHHLNRSNLLLLSQSLPTIHSPSPHLPSPSSLDLGSLSPLSAILSHSTPQLNPTNSSPNPNPKNQIKPPQKSTTNPRFPKKFPHFRISPNVLHLINPIVTHSPPLTLSPPPLPPRPSNPPSPPPPHLPPQRARRPLPLPPRRPRFPLLLSLPSPLLQIPPRLHQPHPQNCLPLPHELPPLANLLLQRLLPHLYNIYIHADPTIDITIKPPFKPDHFIPSKKTQRSSPTLIAAARLLLANARLLLANAFLHDRHNAFFALISQHCIPLHSFSHVYKTLFRRSTMDHRRLQYRSFIEITSNETFMSNRYNARGKNAMMPEVPFDRFKSGSQFFILTRRHAVVVVRDQRLWRKFKLPCLNAKSCYPEEHYFPTLLSMEDPKGYTKYTLTRVNWTGTVSGHPHTYRAGEVSPELIYKLRETNFSQHYLFARKFSPDCLNPLLNISDSVIFWG